MLAIGVPLDWTETVRAANEDDFLTIAEHLPPEAAEALLDYAATGIMPSPPLAPEPPPVDADIGPEPGPSVLDFAANADTQRRFRVVENVEEMEAALAHPWERWTVLLHPVQRAIAEQSFSGAARVMAPPGPARPLSPSTGPHGLQRIRRCECC